MTRAEFIDGFAARARQVLETPREDFTPGLSERMSMADFGILCSAWSEFAGGQELPMPEGNEEDYL